MATSLQVHHVDNVRLERIFDKLGAVTMELVVRDGNNVEVTLFGVPAHVRSKLRHALSDKRTWDDDDVDDTTEPADSDAANVVDFVVDDPIVA